MASADAAAAGIDEADAEDMSLDAGEGSARSAAEVSIRPLFLSTGVPTKACSETELSGGYSKRQWMTEPQRQKQR